MKADLVVVGAGFAGAVVAREAADAGLKVLVLEKRSHIAGNAFDEPDSAGVVVHRYGPHIFHTNGQRIADYLTRFTEWRDYEHRVRAVVGDRTYPIPINRTTINQLYGLSLDERGVEEYLERVRERREPIRTSEDVVLNSVGTDLCEKFFRNYTRKQWGLDLSELSPGVAARIPTRTNDDDRYFTDDFQKMPRYGYTKLFENLLDDPDIRVELGAEFESDQKRFARHVVYTGPIDAYFDFRFGKLPYRSLRFEHQHLPDQEWAQPVGTINYPNTELFTRITEFKHLTGQSHRGTSIVREYPASEGDPYYPIPRPENEMLFKRYEALAKAEPDASFVGRLAQYRYYNMDQVVGASLALASRLIPILKA